MSPCNTFHIFYLPLVSSTLRCDSTRPNRCRSARPIGTPNNCIRFGLPILIVFGIAVTITVGALARGWSYEIIDATGLEPPPAIIITKEKPVPWIQPVEELDTSFIEYGDMTQRFEHWPLRFYFDDAVRRYFPNDAGAYRIIKRIAFCESGFKWWADNPESSADGIFQFIDSTWRGTPQGRIGLDKYNPYANIDAALYLMRTDGFSHWNESAGCWGG